ncbi:MAG TPA: glycosyltransferase [Solirubrobacteraceae bacterium]|nr:glycosyltransferase [Solirubrobacteraceae bacterium]
MRVLFTTRGSSGHVGPLAPFAHACVRAGHEVLVSAQRQFEGNVTRSGLPFAPVDEPARDDWMPMMAKFAELDIDTADGVMISQFFAGLDLRAELPALRALVESWRPDVIVRETWEFGSTLVAELHQVPIVRVGLGLAEMEESSIKLAAPEVDKARAEEGLPPDPEGERLADAPFMTMIPAELEDPNVSAPARTSRFRFEVKPGAEALPDWWPGNVDPLVYLSFGSVAAGSHLPYYPALYRSAIEALSPLPIRLLVTVGDAARAIEELGDVPPSVHVETWVTHDDAVRSADVIVCHGGFGSTLGSLAHGVPLVVLPLFSGDQWANGEAVSRSGAGVTVADDRTVRNVLDLPGPETLGRLAGAVTSVLNDPSYRREAGRIAEAMRALPPVDESVQLLETAAAQQDGRSVQDQP